MSNALLTLLPKSAARYLARFSKEQRDNVPVVTGGLHLTKHEFLWKIENFNLMLNSDKGIVETQEVTFPLDVGEFGDYPTKWRVYLQSKSSTEDRRIGVDAIGIFHELEENPNIDVFMSTIFGVVIKSADIRLETAMGPAAESRGFANVMLKGMKLSEDGSARIGISLTVATPKLGRRVVNAIEFERQAAATLMRDLEMTCLNAEGRDGVEIVCDQVKFPSSKFMLSMRSPVFKAMFESSMMENVGNEVVVTDISRDTLETMLHYIHTGKLRLPGLESSERIIQVAYAADKYQLTELHGFCDEILAKEWDKMKATELLESTSRLRLVKTNREIGAFIRQLSSRCESTN